MEGAEGGLCKELASKDVKMSDMLFSWLKNHRSRVNWLVVSTHLKNIRQNGNLPPNRGENKKYLKPPPR